MWAQRTEERLSVSDGPLFWDANDRYLQPGRPSGWCLCPTGAWRGCGNISKGQRGLVRNAARIIAPKCQQELLWDILFFEQWEKFQEKIFWFGLNQRFRSFLWFSESQASFCSDKSKLFQ